MTEEVRVSDVEPLLRNHHNYDRNETPTQREKTENSLTPEQALIHMIKVMMGTGMLSLPLAFKHSGLYLGLFLLIVICFVCTYCCRQLVHSAKFVCTIKGLQKIDYANVMRTAVELGPNWIKHRGYAAKQLVNINMFIAQIGFCCVYFVFMADNLKQFFDETSTIQLSQATWIALLFIPIMGLCLIRHLKVLAPLALAGNFVYVFAVGIVISYLFKNINPSWSVPAIGDIRDLPLFFGTVMFAFEGICVILPIENQMSEPEHFISYTGVLNTSCALVLAVYCTIGYFGYLTFQDTILDTITLNLPNELFYQGIKILFVLCIMVSFPLQFYVPIERIEKWITRKIAPEKQTMLIYSARGCLVLFILSLAELIPHLALFISLVGSFAGTALALLFPPVIELLVYYSQDRLTSIVWIKNIFLMSFGLLGFVTGTYSSLKAIGQALFI
ncbi:Amino acid transporter, transmembrane family-containing protein [Strongyloides ratti]|uniref:Amino acid transporter, transmembrane family-containing protein n=1 Tax=Strongyloides ratti TaxID=34506 RepID=A0A090LFN0_STRRB|nr:Amino acid transporter, transmembrane family-containing protein [Strongyloides ratti]CEF68572.1 Amino acid transporter, transmembrane family-containing protein [Strongyloides ratti]